MHRTRFTVVEIPRKVNKTVYMRTGECAAAPEPITVANRPFPLENPQFGDKKYFWCACGLSRKQPFCDSSHIGTAFSPLPFYIHEKVSTVLLCLCKKTSSPPYCDGNTCS